MSRFAYEEAEELLDEFAEGPRPLAFQRAYRKFKFAVAAYAYIDFSNRKELEEEEQKLALSKAWEDAQMAFTGHGEMALAGSILQMWANLQGQEKTAFRKVLREAFRRAEEATPDDAPRRYLHKYRLKPPRKPEQDWTLPTILPMEGQKLRDWAIDHNEDPEEVAYQWHWLEIADRREAQGKLKPESGESPAGKVRGHLTLIEPEEQ